MCPVVVYMVLATRYSIVNAPERPPSSSASPTMTAVAGAVYCLVSHVTRHTSRHDSSSSRRSRSSRLSCLVSRVVIQYHPIDTRASRSTEHDVTRVSRVTALHITASKNSSLESSWRAFGGSPRPHHCSRTRDTRHPPRCNQHERVHTPQPSATSTTESACHHPSSSRPVHGISDTPLHPPECNNDDGRIAQRGMAL